MEKFHNKIKAIKNSRHLHSKWYREQYPDVSNVGMEPAEHYLRYGAAMGRNPGRYFDNKFYIETHLAAEGSKLNPLLHYVLQGRAEGCRISPPEDDDGEARRKIGTLRDKLLGLGFTEEPLAELKTCLATSPNALCRAMAARELALWHMRARTDEDCRAALRYVARAREAAPDLDFRSRLTTVELLCHHFLGQEARGRQLYKQAGLRGEASPDVMLAWVNYQPTPEARVLWINQVLRRFAIPPVALLPRGDLPAYDRLTSAETPPIVPAAGRPKVSVLLAAHDAAPTLPTALRSLQEQTWQNLEIVVIDDCSSDDTCAVAERFAARDPRIRLIRMEENGGAYVARNRGLDAATGDYVTIHDADDWSHPIKIATQVRFLEENPKVMGCTSEQARATPGLAFTKLRGKGGFIIFNTSSFLYRKKPVQDALGYWDTVRFGADNEFIRRMQKVFGNDSFRKIRTGPLSFQREGATSITTDPIKGVNGFYYGARKEYFEAQRHHHDTSEILKYSGNADVRPFPAPELMLTGGNNETARPRHFNVIFFGEFREATPDMEALATEIAVLREAGKRVALVEHYDYTRAFPNGAGMCAPLRNLVDGEAVQVLVYGDTVTCDELKGINGNTSLDGQRYLPTIILT